MATTNRGVYSSSSSPIIHSSSSLIKTSSVELDDGESQGDVGIEQQLVEEIVVDKVEGQEVEVQYNNDGHGDRGSDADGADDKEEDGDDDDDDENDSQDNPSPGSQTDTETEMVTNKLMAANLSSSTLASTPPASGHVDEKSSKSPNDRDKKNRNRNS